MGFTAKSQRLQRIAPPPVKGLVPWSIALSVGIENLVGSDNQLAGRFDIVLLVRVFPSDQMLDVFKAAVAWRILSGRAVIFLRLVIALR